MRQLMNTDRLFKHLGATLESLVAIIDLTTNKLATRLALFRWLVFNTVVANDDSHLKNLSFHASTTKVCDLRRTMHLLSTAHVSHEGHRRRERQMWQPFQ